MNHCSGLPGKRRPYRSASKPSKTEQHFHWPSSSLHLKFAEKVMNHDIRFSAVTIYGYDLFSVLPKDQEQMLQAFFEVQNLWSPGLAARKQKKTWNRSIWVNLLN